MFFDVTAHLMNDPSTRQVRSPTEREQRLTLRRTGPGASRWAQMDVGDFVTGLTENQSRCARTWFWVNHLVCRTTKMVDGTYRVERVE